MSMVGNQLNANVRIIRDSGTIVMSCCKGVISLLKTRRTKDLTLGIRIGGMNSQSASARQRQGEANDDFQESKHLGG